MISIRNLSLRRKQMLIIMLTSSVVLLLACAAFVTYDTVTFRRRLVESVSVLADVIGKNCAAAIDFNDAKAAGETLEALRANENIVSACVYSRDGRIFAVYQRDPAQAFDPPTRGAAAQEFTGDQLHLFRPINQRGEMTGAIFVASDLKDLSARLLRYLCIVGVVFVVALLVAFMLSSRLQRLVSEPILQLARVARAVALEKNYSVRATKHSPDELGQLVDGFNEMLAQIQERDGALQAARDNLEYRVEARTGELASSVALLNATLEASVDGILAVDLQGNVTSYNRRFAELWQFSDEILARRRLAELADWAGRQLKNATTLSERVQQLRNSPERENFDVLEFRDGRIVERLSRPQHIGEKCVGSVIAFRDITERKQAEAMLRRTEELYRRAIAGADAVPYSSEFKTRSYLFMGEGIQQLTGYAPHEVTGELWQRIIQKSVMLGEAAGLDKEEAARRVTSGELRQWRCDMCITTRDGKTRWLADASVLDLDEAGRPIGSMGIIQDITERKEAEAKLEAMHSALLNASRQAGMAEVATNVLHNVGNVLNSVNVSTGLIVEQVKKSRGENLARVVALLQSHAPDLGTYLTTDPKGRHVPTYLAQLAEQLLADQRAVVGELDSLQRNVEHIKEIVAMQQSYARFGGVKELINVVDLVEDGLRMNEGALGRHRVEVVREFEKVPPLNVEKHKVLQILVNLLRNAKHACQDSDRDDRRLTVRVSNGAGRVRISVVDNGVGIPSENLIRIFNHGFTTRKTGHGFGLHSGALAAKEMGGALEVHSDGPGQGAVFTLELPVLTPEISEAGA